LKSAQINSKRFGGFALVRFRKILDELFGAWTLEKIVHGLGDEGGGGGAFRTEQKLALGFGETHVEAVA